MSSMNKTTIQMESIYLYVKILLELRKSSIFYFLTVTGFLSAVLNSYGQGLQFTQAL